MLKKLSRLHAADGTWSRVGNIKGNREQGIGNSVGFGRGFEERPKPTAYRGGGL